MEAVLRVKKTDLARKTRQIIHRVQRGQPAIVENHGQPEVAVIDVCDYRIMRAVMRYYVQPITIDITKGLTDKELSTISSVQQRYNLVFAHYLAGAISLAHAAELLLLSWLDLRTRCLRLDVPLRTAPADMTEARADIEMAMAWRTPL